jgi:hypothetical protein
MAREAFIDKKFSAKSKAIIQIANAILAEYAAQGYDLSLRQLFYQFVSRDYLPNTTQNYNNLGSVISDARLAGQIDWNMIRDRGRTIVRNNHWDSPSQILRASANQFRIELWEDQPCHVEVMVEKQALEGVLVPVCRELDVTFAANKGYSSSSAVYEASKRMLYAAENGKDIVVLYLGDHDASGIDMTRDIRDRLSLFLGIEFYHDGVRYTDPDCTVNLTVNRLALNMDQIEEYEPPENPAKLTDSRAEGYIALYGNSSWELDALEPTILGDLVRNAVYDVRDEDKWGEAVKKQQNYRDALNAFADEWDAAH